MQISGLQQGFVWPVAGHLLLARAVPAAPEVDLPPGFFDMQAPRRSSTCSLCSLRTDRPSTRAMANSLLSFISVS